jgi:DNA-binding transcriptional regulator YiaG
MPNIAAVLRDEIVRLARREIRAEIDKLKQASTKYRTEIAALKREVGDLQRQLARQAKLNGHAAHTEKQGDAAPKVRFSAARLRRHRERLELSQIQFGRLLGVSAQTIYNWESGTRPGKEHLPAIAALRQLTKRAAHDHLAAKK